MDRMNKGCVAEEKRNSWRGLGARCLLWCWSGEIAGSLEGFPMNNCMINKRETMTYEVTSRGNKSSLIFSVKKAWWRKIHGNSLPSPKRASNRLPKPLVLNFCNFLTSYNDLWCKHTSMTVYVYMSINGYCVTNQESCNEIIYIYILYIHIEKWQ